MEPWLIGSIGEKAFRGGLAMQRDMWDTQEKNAEYLANQKSWAQDPNDYATRPMAGLNANPNKQYIRAGTAKVAAAAAPKGGMNTATAPQQPVAKQQTTTAATTAKQEAAPAKTEAPVQGSATPNYDSVYVQNVRYTTQPAAEPGIVERIMLDPSGFNAPYMQQPAVTTSKFNNVSVMMPAAQAKNYTDIANYIRYGKHKDNANVKRISQYAKNIGMDPRWALAIYANESNFGRATGDAGKGATSGMQIKDIAYKDVIENYLKFDRSPAANSILRSLPKDYSKASAAEKEQVAVMYANLLRLRAKAQGMPEWMAFARYQGADGYDPKKNNWDISDGYSTRGDYTARAIGYYNAFNPDDQMEIPQELIDWNAARGQKQDAGLKEQPQQEQAVQPGAQAPAQAQAQYAQVNLGSQGGQPQQVNAGVDISGTYNAYNQARDGVTKFNVMNTDVPPATKNLVQMRNVYAMRAESALKTGAFNMYEQYMQKQIASDAQIYTQLAEQGAAELQYHHAPERLLALMDGVFGGDWQVQLRSDGKINLFNNGQLVSGNDGITAADLAKQVKNTVSEQARSQYIAAMAKAAEYQQELTKVAMQNQGAENVARIKGGFDLASADLKGQYDMTTAQMKAYSAIEAAVARSGGRIKQLGKVGEDGLAIDYYGTPLIIKGDGTVTTQDGKVVRTGPQAQQVAGLPQPTGSRKDAESEKIVLRTKNG